MNKTLNITKLLQSKIDYLITSIANCEWSGILFYNYHSDNIINGLDVFPMNIGSSCYTEFEINQEVIAYMVDNDFIIEVDFKTLRETILSLKSNYNSTPFLKPFYKIDIEFDTKEDVIIKLKLTTYKYNYKNYLDDFLKFRPKVINQINNDLNNIYKEV